MYLFYNLCKIHYWFHAKLIICNDFDITDMPFRKHEVPLQMLIKHEIQNGNTISKLLIYTLHWGKFVLCSILNELDIIFVRGEIWVHKTGLTRPLFSYWGGCIKPGKWSVMYMLHFYCLFLLNFMVSDLVSFVSFKLLITFCVF